MAVLLGDPPPVVGGATRLHHHVGRRRLREKAGEPRAVESRARPHAPPGIGDRQREHGLR